MRMKKNLREFPLCQRGFGRKQRLRRQVPGKPPGGAKSNVAHRGRIDPPTGFGIQHALSNNLLQARPRTSDTGGLDIPIIAIAIGHDHYRPKGSFQASDQMYISWPITISAPPDDWLRCDKRRSQIVNCPLPTSSRCGEPDHARTILSAHVEKTTTFFSRNSHFSHHGYWT